MTAGDQPDPERIEQKCPTPRALWGSKWGPQDVSTGRCRAALEGQWEQDSQAHTENKGAE